jgi:hypothetical protein
MDGRESDVLLSMSGIWHPCAIPNPMPSYCTDDVLYPGKEVLKFLGRNHEFTLPDLRR